MTAADRTIDFDESDRRLENEDRDIQENFLEWISADDHLEQLMAWLAKTGQESLPIERFLTDEKYATLRKQAFEALTRGGNGG